MKIQIILALIVLLASGIAPAATSPDDDGAGPGHVEPAPIDSATRNRLEADSMAMDPDAEGGVLPRMVIEAEDRVEITFERPRIELDLAPRSAPGLGWDECWQKADLFPAALAHSSLERPTTLGRPWLDGFVGGDVVVFSPQAEKADRWRLTVVDSRGKTVRVYSGEGSPDERIAWDGRRTDGSAAWPGLVYTQVLETVDRAGNVRTFTGEGFELPPLRLHDRDGMQLVLAGDRMARSGAETANGDSLLENEIASWLNQTADPRRTIVIRTTARNERLAERLAERMLAELQDRVLGPRTRWRSEPRVVADAPDGGVIEIALR